MLAVGLGVVLGIGAIVWAMRRRARASRGGQS
jgi:hypothetical protein